MAIKRKWDISSDEVRRKCIDQIMRQVEEVSGEEIGIIAAEEIMDIVAEHIGPEIYNKGVTDAKKLISSKLADLEVDLSMLEQR